MGAGAGRHAAGFLAGLPLCAALIVAAAPRAQDELDLVATRTGFRPKVLNLRRGEPVRLRLTTEDEEHCLAVDAFRVEKRILPGKTTSLDLSPDRAGSFPFYCCLEPANEALKGRIVVAE